MSQGLSARNEGVKVDGPSKKFNSNELEFSS